MSNLQIPAGWTFTRNPKSLANLFPPKLPVFKGMLFMIGSHGFFSINASTCPDGICYIERHLRKKYGDKAVEWVLYSIPHTNYSDNKKIVRDNMSVFPEKDKLFIANSVSAVLKNMPRLSFLDESEEKEKRAEEFYQALIKSFRWEDKKREHVIFQEFLQFIEEDRVFLNRLLDTFIRRVCLELASYRESSLESETKECFEEGRERFPHLKFDENKFKDCQPLIGIFPWFKYVAFELAKEIIYVKPNSEDTRFLLNWQYEESHPFFLCDDELLKWKWDDEDEEPSESFGGPLEAPRGKEGGAV
jgi:hypothetical protein